MPMYKDDWQSFWQHLQAGHGQHHVVTNKNNSQISCKISGFGHPLFKGNGILCCKEMYSLLFEWFLTFSRCIRMIRGAFGSIYTHLGVLSFLPKTTVKFHAKYHILGTLDLRTWNMTMCYNERYPLLFDCLMTLVRYTRVIRRAPGRIYNPGMVHTVSFCQKYLPNFMQISAFGHPPCIWNGMICCTLRQPLLLECFITFLR